MKILIVDNIGAHCGMDVVCEDLLISVLGSDTKVTRLYIGGRGVLNHFRGSYPVRVVKLFFNLACQFAKSRFWSYDKIVFNCYGTLVDLLSLFLL